LLLIAPAVVVKVPAVEPLMLTLPGTGSNALLLLRFTVTVPVGAPLNVTVQVVVCPLPNAAGEQLTEESCTAATRFSVKLCDWPPPLAVISAD
jgi:hypothetical protein